MRLDKIRERARASILPGQLISPQDIAVLQMLARYRYLRSGFLYALLKRSDRAVRRNLHKLHGNGYIRLPDEQGRMYNGINNAFIYEITAKGREYLKDRGLLPHLATPMKAAPGERDKQFGHNMMICDTTASIEIAAGDRFIPFGAIMEGKEPTLLRLPCSIVDPLTKKAAKKRETYLVPDNLFGIRHGELVSFFALEAEHYNAIETTDLDRSSWRKKVIGYRDLIRNERYKQLGLSNLRVLGVFDKPESAVSALKLTEKILQKSSVFLMHSVPIQEEIYVSPKPFPELFTGEWMRAGLPPARLDV